MPSCIFHLPMQIRYNLASASQIRPQKMLQAFRDIGYDVAVVMGNAAERKKQAADVKRRIAGGEQFDFLYSESSTMPTQLTEPNHIPVSSSIDFGLFKFCRNNGIKCGLFYRDVYWKFPAYREIGFLKSAIALHYYRKDLREYSHLLDAIYMPTDMAFRIVDAETTALRRFALPPGCDIDPVQLSERVEGLKKNQFESSAPVRLLYVGGIGSHYGFDSLIAALRIVARDVEVTFCVREHDFAAYSRASELEAMPNINIVHAAGSQLEELYAAHDAALMFFDADPYQKAAMPFKTFEYIAHGLPIVSNGGTAAADFVREKGVGWVEEGSSYDLAQLLAHISANRIEIAEKAITCAEVALENTWADRARFVTQTLG